MTPKAPNRIELLDVRKFPALAAKAKICETERTLILTSRLTRITVGRRTFYPWSEVLDLMPEWAHERYAKAGRGDTR